jgi:hypothetical protein
MLFQGIRKHKLSRHAEQVVRLPEDADIKLNLYEYGDNDMSDAEAI